jgi:hypothetical protein
MSANIGPPLSQPALRPLHDNLRAGSRVGCVYHQDGIHKSVRSRGPRVGQTWAEGTDERGRGRRIVRHCTEEHTEKGLCPQQGGPRTPLSVDESLVNSEETIDEIYQIVSIRVWRTEQKQIQVQKPTTRQRLRRKEKSAWPH